MTMQVINKQSIIHFTGRITMANKRTTGQIVDNVLDAVKKGGNKIGSGIKFVGDKANKFAGKHKAALIASGVVGAGAGTAGYALGRRKSGGE
jgi:hypothetical protein